GMVEHQLDCGVAGYACVKLVLDTPRGLTRDVREGFPGIVEHQLDCGVAGYACVKLVLDTPRGLAPGNVERDPVDRDPVEFHLDITCFPETPQAGMEPGPPR